MPCYTYFAFLKNFAVVANLKDSNYYGIFKIVINLRIYMKRLISVKIKLKIILLFELR